jgi:hypothetical protein
MSMPLERCKLGKTKTRLSAKVLQIHICKVWWSLVVPMCRSLTTMRWQQKLSQETLTFKLYTNTLAMESYCLSSWVQSPRNSKEELPNLPNIWGPISKICYQMCLHNTCWCKISTQFILLYCDMRGFTKNINISLQKRKLLTPLQKNLFWFG